MVVGHCMVSTARPFLSVGMERSPQRRSAISRVIKIDPKSVVFDDSDRKTRAGVSASVGPSQGLKFNGVRIRPLPQPCL